MKSVVFETGGKQYRAVKGDELFIEKLDVKENQTVEFDKVLLLDGKAGNPYVSGAKVTAKVLKNGKAPKVVVFKFHRRKSYHKKQGHRQPFTKIKITKIEG